MSEKMTEIEQKHEGIGDSVAGNKQTNNHHAPTGISGTRDVYVEKLEVNSSSLDILGVTIDIGKSLKDCTAEDFEKIEKLLSMVAQRPVKIKFSKEGSIKLFLSGSQEGLQRLADLQLEGKLEELLNELKPDDMPEIKVQKAEFIEDEEVIQKAELIKAIRQGEADKTKLRKADLSGANLYGANWNQVNLIKKPTSEKTSSIKVNLIKPMSDANLSRANLIEANLSRANLYNANLIGANLSRANLYNANLSRANLYNANLIGANLIGVNLIGVNLSVVNLIGANLIEADLSGANLYNANLSGANLYNANLSRANLIGAKLIGAKLIGADLIGADLIGADLIGADLIGADLIGADLSKADLSGTDLSGANLYNANLSGADLSAVKINEKTQLDNKWCLVHEIVNNSQENRDLHSQDLSFANLQYSFLFRANLIGTDLSKSNLKYANLQEADLSGSNLTNANLKNANLIDAVFDHAIVQGAWFKDNEAITEGLKRDLIARGAIFADDFGAGDRVLVGV